MNKVILMLCLSFGLNASADLADCSKFVGYYQSVDSRNKNVEISLTASEVVFRYNRNPTNPSEGYSMGFIPDGIEHQGSNPMNTGKSYLATCSANSIQLVRYGFLRSPYTTTLTLQNSELREMGELEGSTLDVGYYQRSTP